MSFLATTPKWGDRHENVLSDSQSSDRVFDGLALRMVYQLCARLPKLRLFLVSLSGTGRGLDRHRRSSIQGIYQTQRHILCP